jgi:hypothetical protein
VRGENPVQCFRHVADAARLVGVGAGVDDQVRDPQEVAALQLVDEGGDGLLAQVAGVGAEIHQIACVDGHGERGRGPELRDVGGGDLLGPPHPAGFREDLHGLGAVGQGAGEGLVQATGGALVGSQQHMGSLSGLWADGGHHKTRCPLLYSLAARLRFISFQPGMK